MKVHRAQPAHYSRTHVYLDGHMRQPKHLFVVLGNTIDRHIKRHKQPIDLLDVGGAAGAFVSYLLQRFPDIGVACLDSDMALVEQGAKNVPGSSFYHGDANDMHSFGADTYDVVTMTGTMSIFDDFTLSLGECIRVCKPGGRILITGQFNDYPVDALIKWRYSDDNGRYNSGYNLFSKKSVSSFLKRHPKVQAWTFEKFVLPFDIDPQKDPIRTWTEKNLLGERIFKNGLQMEINLQILEIEI